MNQFCYLFCFTVQCAYSRSDTGFDQQVDKRILNALQSELQGVSDEGLTLETSAVICFPRRLVYAYQLQSADQIQC